MDYLLDLGMHIALMREYSGYKSQRQLSLASGISSATLSRIEAGLQKPTPETLMTLSKYLKGITYEELMHRAGYMFDFSKKNEDGSFGWVESDDIKGKGNQKSAPEWATSRDIRDFKKFLEQQEVMFDGMPMSAEDKARVIGFMESHFWEAKQMNKRKKKDEDKA